MPITCLNWFRLPITWRKTPTILLNKENEFTWNAGLSLEIPVFHWGEKRLKKLTQQMSVDKSEYNLEQAEEGLTLEIQQAIFRLKESMIKLNFTIVSMEQANENLKLENNRLKEGRNNHTRTFKCATTVAKVKQRLYCC